MGSDVIRDCLLLLPLEQEIFSLRNRILENCRLHFNINQISTLNMISENNLIFLFFSLSLSLSFPPPHPSSNWSALCSTMGSSWSRPRAACNLNVKLRAFEQRRLSAGNTCHSLLPLDAFRSPQILSWFLWLSPSVEFQVLFLLLRWVLDKWV